MEFIWESRDLEKLSANLLKSREVVLANLNRALRKIGHVIAPELKRRTPRGATHHLADYTVAQVLGTAEDMRLEIRQAAQSSMGYYYGRAVRGGTRPHFPPPGALIPWVEAVLGVRGKEAKSVAFLIARKISKVGTAPNPYHVRALEASQGRIQAIVDEAGISVAAQVADVK